MSGTPSTKTNAAPATGVAPVLDAERLDCYRVALEFQAASMALAECCDAVLRDQLRRASLSIVLNIAEGAGRRGPREKRRFYGIARGSTTECGAIVDILKARGVASPTECVAAKTLLVRIVQMLTKLDRRLE